MKNVRKVVRDYDKVDVPFYIGDFGDHYVELYVGKKYSIFCGDDNVPLKGGPRSQAPVMLLSDLPTRVAPSILVDVHHPRSSGTIIHRINTMYCLLGIQET